MAAGAVTGLLSELAQLDRRGDIAGALRLIAERRLGAAELIQLAAGLYEDHRDATAFLIASKLGDQGVSHWALDVIRAHVGALADLGEPAAAARTRLRLTLGTLAAGEAAQCRRLLESRLCDDVKDLSAATDTDLILRLLELSKIATPVLEAYFPDRTTAAPAATTGTRRAPLALPPPPAVRRARSAVVLMQERLAANTPRARKFDLGPRMVAAMEGYGWSARATPVRSVDDPAILAADQAAALELCQRTGAGVLFAIEYGVAPLGRFFAEARSRLPGLAVVMLILDPWVRKRWPAFRQAAAEADLVWSPFPSVELWEQPEFRGKMLFLPLPPGPVREPPPWPDRPSLSFTGTLGVFNWMRNYWLAALHHAGVPVRHVLTSDIDDGLPPLAGYGRYLERLGATGCALNLCLRSQGVRTLVGRTFEAPWAGALLVEEDNDDVGHYFTPGEHVLTFSTLPDLLDIVALIRDAPETAEAIRRRGHAFAIERYSDERVIGGLDGMLG